MNLDEKSCTYSQQFSVLIPCKDEQATIAQVISAFRAELPAAEIIVCDNNSQDETASLAGLWSKSGAKARGMLSEPYLVLLAAPIAYWLMVMQLI